MPRGSDGSLPLAMTVRELLARDDVAGDGWVVGAGELVEVLFDPGVAARRDPIGVGGVVGVEAVGEFPVVGDAVVVAVDGWFA